MDQIHLFLTSGGLTKNMKNYFFDIIGKRPEEVKILYIPTAAIETDGAREGIAVCLYELSLMGIRSENIFVYNLELILSKGYKRTFSSYVTDEHMASRLLSTGELKEFDAVFVGGGDCAVLCREMVRTGFDHILEQAVNEGLVYVGISAGSMYAAGNLKNGLNMIPNPIIPHWNGDREMSLPIDHREIHLADGQAVYIEGSNVCLL
ncbi:MAG: peptidase E [Acetatifactor sp.]|nr:peptidase E [Acetatifactor sp.]MDE7045044.1 peptidase E [Acetatifactor sp.]